jgi:hypothetical protein
VVVCPDEALVVAELLGDGVGVLLVVVGAAAEVLLPTVGEALRGGGAALWVAEGLRAWVGPAA